VLDFDRAERCALREAFRRLRMPFRRGTLDRYRAINARLWTAYTRGEISGARVALQRFEELLAALGEATRAPRLARAYLAALRLRGDTLPGARRALRLLRRRFRVAIVTNGYTRVQRSRLRRAGLLPLLDAVVTSESAPQQP
jgi:FMN phosphatase YigB (HAD superfamily)